MTRLFPYPLLALALLAIWLLLNLSVSPGQILLGAVFATGACWGVSLLRPAKPRLRRLDLAIRLFLLVTGDIARSNLAVAKIILRPRHRERRSAFVTIPLALREPNGLSILAIILTAAPGTAWVEYDSSRGTLLMHVLDLVDEEAWIATVKERYESKLMEIFR